MRYRVAVKASIVAQIDLEADYGRMAVELAEARIRDGITAVPGKIGIAFDDAETTVLDED